MTVQKMKCFVIMPLSKTSDKHTEQYWTNHFKEFLKPLIEEERSLEAHRSEALRGSIINRIITDLVTARIVVADLTDHNPNVFWELGVRQSFKHGAVTIAQTGTELPFDIGGKGTLFYDPTDYIILAGFRSKFKQAIHDCLINPNNPDSHVLETLSGRGTLFEIFNKDQAIRRLNAILQECDANKKTINSALTQAKENQEQPNDEPTFITSRLTSPTIEFLIVNRYVDEGNEFYQANLQYLSDISAWNAQLNIWEQRADATETWIIENASDILELIKKIRSNISNAQKKLEQRA